MESPEKMLGTRRCRFRLRVPFLFLLLFSLSSADLLAGIGLGGRFAPIQTFPSFRPSPHSWRWRLASVDSIRLSPDQDKGGLLLQELQRSPALNSGRLQSQNIWLLACGGLILFFVLPGLALFYGALHQAASVTRLLRHCAGAAGLVSILWWMFGYSLVFGDGGNTILGDITQFAFLRNLGSALPMPPAGFGGSPAVFCAYQLILAVVPAVLMVAITAHRVRFSIVLVFVVFWSVFVYFPLAHMFMGANGLMNGLWNPKAKIRALDFGGGALTQMAAGWSAFILFLTLGNQKTERPAPLSQGRLLLFFLGEAMLWFGWYGFINGASGTTRAAAQAFTSTTIAALVAAFAWATADQTSSGKAANLGAFSGIIAGLAAITPAAGFVGATGALVIGLCAGLIPLVARLLFRLWGKRDQVIETFCIHALGGLIGMVMTGVLVSPQPDTVAGTGGGKPVYLHALDSLLANGDIWVEQLKAITLTATFSGFVSLLLAFFLRGLRETTRFGHLFQRPMPSTGS